MKKIIIEIEGMHCASCASHIEKALSKIPNVSNIRVNAIMGKAFLDIEDNVREIQLQKAVEDVGYIPRKIKIENRKFNNSEKINNLDKHPKKDETNIWFKKLFIVWALTIPIIFIMYSEKIIGKMIIPENLESILLLLFSFPIIFILGHRTIKSGLKGFYTFYFSMDSLISLGTIIAFSTGILSWFIDINNFSGISGMIMAIFITGKYIESKAKGKATNEIKKLLEIEAKKATIIRDKKEIEISVSEIKLRDIIVIKPGEKIPTDGIIVKGESSIDESMITGESIPVDKKIKDNVIGATINQEGILYVRATKIGKDTFLSHIIKVVDEAQGTKIPIQKLADRITNIFVPFILVLSVAVFFGWIFIGKANIGEALNNAISVLVIACPCALGLAVPISLTVGSGIGAKKGILIRKGEAIQTMKGVRTIVFDKTGTITKGRPEVTEICSKNKEHLLKIAGSIERLSEHPIAKAIVKKADSIKYLRVKKFKNFKGRGVEGEIGKVKITIGNEVLMNEKNISLKGVEDNINDFEKKGYTTMIVAENKKIIGIIGVSDEVKKDSATAIKKLSRYNYRLIMITGDNQITAETIAKKVGIKETIANVLPEAKFRKIKELQKYGMVAFVGDGINDAPALKQANVGIAIGTGTDIAIESGDIVLAKGSLMGVVQAVNLSKATFSKIKQNLFWAFAYNITAIPLAVAGVLNPVIAEIAMALSSITVIINANLLKRKTI